MEAPFKKRRTCVKDGHLQTITDADRDTVVEIEVPSRSNFTLEFSVDDGSNNGADKHAILFGIMPRNVVARPFSLGNGHPKHGFFVDDLMNCCGQDGTNRRLPGHWGDGIVGDSNHPDCGQHCVQANPSAMGLASGPDPCLAARGCVLTMYHSLATLNAPAHSSRCCFYYA